LTCVSYPAAQAREDGHLPPTRRAARKENAMNPYLPHALVALVLALPALAATRAGSEPPAEAQASHAAQEGHATQEGHAAPHDSAMPDEHAAHDAHAGQADSHGTDADAPPAIRWASDAPLREGMRRVRAATVSLSHGAHGHLDDAQVQAVAAELEAAVQDMIARCRLAPEPDAALHPLLATVLRASAALAADGFDPAVLAELEAVLARYPLLFEDAGWSADHSASA
jgi:hypothetical protein